VKGREKTAEGKSGRQAVAPLRRCAVAPYTLRWSRGVILQLSPKYCERICMSNQIRIYVGNFSGLPNGTTSGTLRIMRAFLLFLLFCRPTFGVENWGRVALGIQPAKWKQIETEHFVIYYFRNGDKIASRSEKFYVEIREFFGNRPDRMPGKKSSVFAFHDLDDWKKFREVTGLPWIAGVTRGDEFFYQSASETGAFDSKGKVQAHEMTHLIFNRFFRGQPPLWLNEGIAEYFGQRKTTGITEFRRQMGATPPVPLAQLFAAQSYPRSELEVQAFYAEAAIVVDFLTRTQDRARLLPAFVERMIERNDVAAALKLYGYPNLPEFEKAYNRYRKQF
jgi:hypothetical protein